MSSLVSRLALRLPLAAAVVLAIIASLAVPQGIYGARLLVAQDDPARLSDVALDRVFDAEMANREIAAALASNDADLAQSLAEIAKDRDIAIDRELAARTVAATQAAVSLSQQTRHFASGFVTGESSDAAGLAGTVTGDLFVFGDVRDVVREGIRAVRGEKVDNLILGLAGAGLAITAGTYASLGAGAPARVGLSVVKAAGKAGRMSGALLRVVRDAAKIGRTGELVALAGDVGRIEAKAGTRATLEGLRLAENPTQVTRFARLAAAKGGKTRAIVKILGRGAIVLTFGAFEIASWIFWAVLNAIALCVALKGWAGRAAQRFIRRRKAAAAARRMALASIAG